MTFKVLFPKRVPDVAFFVQLHLVSFPAVYFLAILILREKVFGFIMLLKCLRTFTFPGRHSVYSQDQVYTWGHCNKRSMSSCKALRPPSLQTLHSQCFPGLVGDCWGSVWGTICWSCRYHSRGACNDVRAHKASPLQSHSPNIEHGFHMQ